MLFNMTVLLILGLCVDHEKTNKEHTNTTLANRAPRGITPKSTYRMGTSRARMQSTQTSVHVARGRRATVATYDSLRDVKKSTIFISTAHNITFLEVPQYGDPRRDVDLVCHYISEKGDPPLHSVKWYRDNNEIFRFTPGMHPSTRTFNTTAGGVAKGFCNMQRCSISVMLPKKYDTKISFTCEVSTEGPRFAVAKQTKHLITAVALKEDPIISGPGSVHPGEEVLINCSTTPAMPPANIMWYVDGILHRPDPWEHDKTNILPADDEGLRSSWKSLKIQVNTPKGYIGLRCEATQPTKIPFVRSSTHNIIIARIPNIGKFTASGSRSTSTKAALYITTVCMSLHIFSKNSALSDV